MTTDDEIIQIMASAFAQVPRPEHFTDFDHCSECREHDETLRARTCETLTYEDLGNPGWDPICFITAEGFRYFLPALFRIALLKSAPSIKLGTTGVREYLPQFVFHLMKDGIGNSRVRGCTTSEREAVVKGLWHIVDSRAYVTDSGEAFVDDFELQRAIEIWSCAKG